MVNVEFSRRNRSICTQRENRLQLCFAVATVLKDGYKLLGIQHRKVCN
ncbi:DALR anticodon-binding domain-containing protein [Solibacillus isronensis]